MRRRLLGLLLPAVLGTSPRTADAQADARPSVRAVRLPDGAGAIQVDGILSEPAWQSTQVATGFRQREPLEGEPATEATEVRIVYDGTTLYVGVLARDRDPDRVISRILQRDRVMLAEQFFGEPIFAGDDGVAVLLDPFHDHRNAVLFATNPNGAEFDALITDEGREFNIDWRGVWEVRAQRTPEGWSAEFAIPFRTLRFPAASIEQTWGLNVVRMIRRKNEEVLWSAWSRSNEGLQRVSRAGHLEGLVDLPRPGLNAEVKPYLLVGGLQEVDSLGVRDSDPELKLGGDLKFEVTSGLVLDLTLNTDFAQVEVDDEQVNLTRFSLFFPEKRDFFLENAGIFEFGARGVFEPPPFLLFFSRQIGIHDDGVVPMIGGVRLTGRVGGQTVGLLNVVTDQAFDQPATNFAVARVKRDIGGANYVGGMLTDRRTKDGWNTAGGADFSWWPASALNVQGFVAGTGTSGPGGDDWAYRVALDYNQSTWGVSAGQLFVGPEAVADMGFITRENIRRSQSLVRLTPRPPVAGLRKIDVFLNGEYITRPDGVLQDWGAGIAVSPEWNSGENLALYAFPGFTRLDEEFELTDDIFIPPGDYDGGQYGFFANSSPNRPVRLDLNGSWQPFYDGTLVNLASAVTVNPDPHLALTAGYAYNDAKTPFGDVRADIGTLRVSYAFSTRVFLNALVQYNGLDDELSANIRFNFIHRPGSDLFIVLNEVRGSSQSIWDFDNRGAVVKITYLARL
jgi:hypothetical protein